MYLFLNLLFGKPAAAQGISNISEDGPGWHQIEMLENHADLLTCLAEFFSGQCRNLCIVHENLSVRRLFQKIDASDQCRFSCSRKSDNTKDISIVDGKAYVIHCMNFFIGICKSLTDVL